MTPEQANKYIQDAIEDKMIKALNKNNKKIYDCKYVLIHFKIKGSEGE